MLALLPDWRVFKLTSCCGATGERMESLCDDCSVEVCDVCAAYFDREDGYGEDGQGVRTHAKCDECAAEDEYVRQRRDQRNDSGV